MTTKTKTESRGKGLCHYESLTRTRFFHGMLLTDEHLRAEQTYHREALKRLNRHLWGAGIVCGLEVRRTSGLCIKVQPGLALDCDGNVIDVCKQITVDLSDLCKKAYPDGCAPDDAATITTYLVLRYREIPADPEPVLTPDDDCTPSGGGTKCEASKYREGFCLDFADECPDCAPCGDEEKEGTNGLLPTLFLLSQTRTDNANVAEQFEQYKRDCMDSPPCDDCHCDDSAVGLAKLEIDCAKNAVTVTCDDCRHYVWSPRLLRWLICGLFANIDKIPTTATGLSQNLPKASALIRSPLGTAWDVGEIALGARRISQLRQDVQNLNARLATVEKAQASRAKPPKQGG